MNDISKMWLKNNSDVLGLRAVPANKKAVRALLVFGMGLVALATVGCSNRPQAAEHAIDQGHDALVGWYAEYSKEFNGKDSFQGYALELSENTYKCWTFSDILIWPLPKYPVCGPYSVVEDMLILSVPEEAKLLLEQKFIVLRHHDNKIYGLYACDGLGVRFLHDELARNKVLAKIPASENPSENNLIYNTNKIIEPDSVDIFSP